MSENFARLLPGRRYVARTDPDGMWIRDDGSRAVAHLPVTPGGEVKSPARSWLVAVERSRRGWVVVARELASEEVVACAYPRGWLNSFRLWVVGGQQYRLRAKPFSGVSTLRGEVGAIARFTSGSKRTITIAEWVTPDPLLTLVVLLALEAIRYSEQIPNSAVGAATS